MIALDRLRARAAGRLAPPLEVPPERLKAIEEAMRKTFKNMAYDASRFGVGPYLSVLRSAQRMGFLPDLIRPRDLARSLAATIGLVESPRPT
ncbi:MAG: hypothetical protein NZM07_11590 [Elioraea sp.]|nr:hypothetical protein [Elioraea sp.]